MSWLRYPLKAGWATALAAAALSITPVASVASTADAPRRVVITVKGLACPFCVYGLEKHLRKLPGAVAVQVDLEKGKATVDLAEDSKATEEDIRKAVKKAGFTVDRIEWQDSRSTPGHSREGFAVRGETTRRR